MVANYKGEGKWLPGRIHRVQPGGTAFDVVFDSGVAEVAVPIEHILPSVAGKTRSTQDAAKAREDPEQVQISIKLPPSVTQPGAKTFNYQPADFAAPPPVAAAPPPVYHPSYAPSPLTTTSTAAAASAVDTSSSLMPSDTLSLVGHDPRLLHVRRRKMHVENLTLLDPVKRLKLVRMLKRKGRFIQISRNMLEGTSRHSIHSLLVSHHVLTYMSSCSCQVQQLVPQEQGGLPRSGAQVPHCQSLQDKAQHEAEPQRHQRRTSSQLRPHLREHECVAQCGAVHRCVRTLSTYLNLCGCEYSLPGGPSALIHNVEAAVRKKEKGRKGTRRNLVDYDSDEGTPNSKSEVSIPLLTEELHQQKQMNNALNAQVEELKERLDLLEKQLSGRY